MPKNHPNKQNFLNVCSLGQTGYLFEHDGDRVAIDPYLTDAVADQFGSHMKRLYPAAVQAHGLSGISHVLLTHAHLDHTDPKSVRMIAAASPAVRFICPYEVDSILLECGIPKAKIIRASEKETTIGTLRIRAIPAAHTILERNSAGELRFMGYLMEWPDCTIYHAGDTIPHSEIFLALAGVAIDYAFLPVNERNYFRNEAGIVGNMSIREAFMMAERTGADVLVPTHWDLFGPNSTFPGEVKYLHKKLAPPFALRFLICGRNYVLTAQK